MCQQCYQVLLLHATKKGRYKLKHAFMQLFMAVPGNNGLESCQSYNGNGSPAHMQICLSPGQETEFIVIRALVSSTEGLTATSTVTFGLLNLWSSLSKS